MKPAGYALRQQPAGTARAFEVYRRLDFSGREDVSR
jgi:hypothetical protein